MKNIFLALVAVTTLSFANEIKTSTLSNQVDLSNYKEVVQKNHKITFDANSSDTNGIYNYDYQENNSTKQDETNVFLDGNFDKIYRYDSLYFDDGKLSEDSNKTFDEFVKKIHSYSDNEDYEIVVSVIGVTQKSEDKDQDINTDSGYSNFFQNIGKRDDLNPDVAVEDARNYMDIVYNKMLDANVSQEIIYKENRAGKDALFTEEFSDGRDLNNRVDVAIYVKEIPTKDTDKDGVEDKEDYCPHTPTGTKVDTNGCPFVLSLNLLFDFDKATISDKQSLKDIEELATFMSKYPGYTAHVIGHTDNMGPDKYNEKLSLRRAKVVNDLIVKHGVKSERLSFEGRGESEPLFENINPFNRHQNRRTEVELKFPKQQMQEMEIAPRNRKLKE